MGSYSGRLHQGRTPDLDCSEKLSQHQRYVLEKVVNCCPVKLPPPPLPHLLLWTLSLFAFLVDIRFCKLNFFFRADPLYWAYHLLFFEVSSFPKGLKVGLLSFHPAGLFPSNSGVCGHRWLCFAKKSRICFTVQSPPPSATWTFHRVTFKEREVGEWAEATHPRCIHTQSWCTCFLICSQSSQQLCRDLWWSQWG